MRTIRELTDADLDAYVTVAANAYPGIKVATEADRQRFRERDKQMTADPIVSLWGLFENGRLLGVMHLFDFEMTLHETPVLVGGVGGVAVDLAYKKRKVAYDMIQFFLRHYREKGAAMTALYPFRPDFYRKMGFGYGAKMNQYRVKPDSLPRASTTHIAFLTERDKEAMMACYGRYAQQTHGMMTLPAYTWDHLFTEPGMKMIGYKSGGKIRGYLVFTFQPGPGGHFLSNEILVRAIVYENKAALAEMLGFLHTQADQIERIVINTQDEDFHFLLADPRTDGDLMLPRVLYHQSNTQGVGLMYRVIDVPRLFELLTDHDFGGQTCRLKLSIRDSFLPDNEGSWVIGFENGRFQPQPNSPHDAEIQLDIASFSSLIMGTVSFRQLAVYGLAQISDSAHIETVDKLFHAAQKPVCMTSF